MMATLGNVIWFLLFGLWLGLSWLMAGIIFCCTIIGIPFGIASFRIAQFAFFPFGKDVVSTGDAGACTFLVNVIWVVVAGVWLWIAAVVAGVCFCITLIGIPFGIACFRIAKVSFAPLGKKIIAK